MGNTMNDVVNKFSGQLTDLYYGATKACKDLEEANAVFGEIIKLIAWEVGRHSSDTTKIVENTNHIHAIIINAAMDAKKHQGKKK